MISSTVTVTQTSAGAPEFVVERVNPHGRPVGRAADIAAGPAGSNVLHPELTPLAHGGEVVTWIDAYSHGPHAEYAVLNAAGSVIAQASYGSGDSLDFTAVALANGGFGLADAETNLFGTSGAVTFQTFDARGGATGPVTTVQSETGHGLSYADLHGLATPRGIELSWTEPGGPHSALVDAGGPAPAMDLGPALHHDPGLFLT